ncbi:MAG: hypothetical protein PWP31_896 [Clostridia bacterium]|nr:hypothetical protein [Clostridia bacterium]
MKIAVANEGNMVAEHFGHCSKFSLFDIENGKVISREDIDNPGHKPGFLPVYLGNLGVKCVIVGGIGSRAVQLFAERGIEVIRGANGSIDAVIDTYLDGKLFDNDNMCDH